MATNTTVVVYDLKTQQIYRVESANLLKHHVIVHDTSGQITPIGQTILDARNQDNADGGEETPTATNTTVL